MTEKQYMICERCGRIYDENESPHFELDYAPRGRVYKTNVATCHCGGELIDAVECQYCGEIIPVETRRRGYNMESLCPVCYEDHIEALPEPRKSA